MALLERVSTLLRANLNDLLARSDDPEKLARQLLLDMENQLVQVKTQVAIAIADQHKLKTKQAEEHQLELTWHRKAENAVAKANDDLARIALERSLTHAHQAEALTHQLAEQQAEVETLRSAYNKLEAKLTETRHRIELLTLQLRRARATRKLTPAPTDKTLSSLTSRAEQSELDAHTARALLRLAAEDPLTTPAPNEAIESLLRELKQKQS